MKNTWEKELLDKFGSDIKRDAMCPLEDFIRQKLIEEYRKGYNDCIEELEIKNDYGEKSL